MSGAKVFYYYRALSGAPNTRTGTSFLKDLKIEASKSYNIPRFLVTKIHERGKGQRIVLIHAIF